jgi:hypothetical protein
MKDRPPNNGMNPICSSQAGYAERQAAKHHNMRRNLHILLLGYLVLSVAPSQAQDDTKDTPVYHKAYWATLGIGSSRFGPCIFFSLSHANKSNLFTLWYLTADEFRFNVEGHYDEPAQRLREVGFLYGRPYRKQALVLSLSAGLGYVSAVDRGKLIARNDYERVNISTLALPFEATFRFEFGFIGIGGSWYGNINPKRSNSGGVFQLSLGVF